MSHTHSERLTTPRLELDPLGPDDADEMVAVLADERLYSFIGGRPPSLNELRARYERLAAGRSADGTEEWHNWIIRRRPDGRAVGTAQATIRDSGTTAEVAWVIGVDWQGKGFATEAARAVVAWLEARGAVTITAHVHPAHHASGAVAAGAGLVATRTMIDGERVWRWRVWDDAAAARVRLRQLSTGELTPAETLGIRELLDAAFGTGANDAFTEEDWQHALGGVHFVLELDGRIVTHAAVVERELHVGDRPLATGYVEAVATAPDRQGSGFGSRVMGEVATFIRRRYELGALGTGRQEFYERLGWLRWLGPTYVRAAGGAQRTADEDGYILVLPTPTSPPLDITAPISCEWRPGDVW
jgi:RimJ/RimL family protein N-acetyltransferase/predicted N-acetyltransferase YhbS